MFCRTCLTKQKPDPLWIWVKTRRGGYGRGRKSRQMVTMMNSCHNYPMVLPLVHTVGNGCQLSGTKQAALLQAALKQVFQWIPTFRGRDIFWCVRKNCPSQTAQSTVIGVANSFGKYSQTLLTFNFRSLSQRDLLLHVAQYSPAEYLARWARRPWGTFPSWLAGWGHPEKEQGLH